MSGGKVLKIMKKGIKKAIGLTIVLVMLFSVVGVSGCNRLANLTEDDFSLTISVNSTTIRVGEYLEIETVFENLSGMKLNISYGNDIFANIFVGEIGSVEYLPWGPSTLERGEKRTRIYKFRGIRSIPREDIELGLISEEAWQRFNRYSIWASQLMPGEYQIKVRVSFTIANRNRTEYLNGITMYSNTVTVTVI